jgi:DNA-binding NarL/FixJ family response regulator
LHAIIMNVPLPELGGSEAATTLTKIDPQIQIILSAGAEIDRRPRETQRLERLRRFPKPLNPEEITGAIEVGAAGSSRKAEGAMEGEE